ncbi:TetR-like C-terminal domain-containing protein [Bacillus halotolerans]|jgi:AcrR family transcriptional regulator|uniref:Transcriptional regulator, AcrR family n=1 Tax=Bacillus mojavensis TaxID=72360 RepID=A0ABX6LUF0_BACMO|nr:TetR/AcrR family transcriptional regulator [Bacillus mojavensis]MCY9187568.1 TetR/AcrR family transcriptional regulator [Bacillus mojavensis]MDR4229265.1 TetR/AcrR family transcriptional regulator [Bacillus mojavensis]MEC1625331.1 TetR-like C-terminal domain-containing protein [Bacillus mojavensis]MEC1679534.1 TetR-like C-terminal domain-containing protein [Bacillus mojavensis]MEC1688556.1 TetR-like C-terminal domain-containing protein [Bacillus mojavensis]
MSKKNKVDPRVKRTNKFLRDALIALLKEKEANSITIQEITEKADLTRGTFYLHYRDKQDFLFQSMTEVLDDLIQQVKPETPVEPVIINEDHPPVSFVKLFEYIHEHAEYFQVMLSDRGLPQFRSLMAEFVQKRIYEELLSSIEESEKQLQIPKEILVSYITSAHIGVICSWLESGMKYSPLFMANQLTRLTLLGPLRIAGIEKQIKLPY